jgi:hypothetical protein
MPSIKTREVPEMPNVVGVGLALRQPGSGLFEWVSK